MEDRLPLKASYERIDEKNVCTYSTLMQGQQAYPHPTNPSTDWIPVCVS